MSNLMKVMIWIQLANLECLEFSSADNFAGFCLSFKPGVKDSLKELLLQYKVKEN